MKGRLISAIVILSGAFSISGLTVAAPLGNDPHDQGFTAKLTGDTVTPRVIHACGRSSPKEKVNVLEVKTDRPLKIAATAYGSDHDIRTYDGINAVYVEVGSLSELAWLKGELGREGSSNTWRYRTAQAACVDKGDNAEVFLFGLISVKDRL